MKRRSFLALFVYIFHTTIANDDMNVTMSVNPTQFFKNINNDASLVTWAHGVNSVEELDEALNSSIMMLETDISSGYVEGEETLNPIPIMAHPPATTSNISLKKWLQTVIKANNSKGIKLDFKNISVVEESLALLKTYESQISFPVFINADILQGPANSSATPVDPDQFLPLVQKHYPECILSVGWTTNYNGTESWYTWQDVITMIETLRKHNVQQEISFPIRAIYLDKSYQQLRWLTKVVPKSGITVWSAKDDPVDASALTSTLVNYDRDSVYYDLPHPLDSAFVQLKNSALPKPITSKISASSWITGNDGCCFSSSEALVLNGSCVVSQADEFKASANPIVIKGVLEFLGENLFESVAIGLRSRPWLWVRIYSGGKVVKPNSGEINNLQSNTSVQCFRFEIEDKGGSNPIKVLITLSEPPTFSSVGEEVSFDVEIPDSVDEGINLAFNSSGEGLKVVHSLDFEI